MKRENKEKKLMLVIKINLLSFAVKENRQMILGGSVESNKFWGF